MMQQQTQTWLDFRKDKVGASDAAVIMEANPWKTPYQLWLEKKGIVEPKKNKAMQYGLDKEMDVRREFYNLTDIAVIPMVSTHRKYEWMIASLDGLSADGRTAVEIKCHLRGDDFFHVQRTGKVPEKYYPQVQHQMEVLDIDCIYYMCFYDGNHCLIEVDRDQDYIDSMLPKLKKFHDCLINDFPPPLSDRDKLYRTDSEWKHLEDEWLTIQEQMELLKEKEKSVRDEMISLCGEKSAESDRLIVTRSFPKGRVNYSKIPELNKVDLDKYRSPSRDVWTIRTKKDS